MSATENKAKKDVFAIVLAVIGLVSLFNLLVRFIDDVRKTTNTDILSEEGKELLRDPEKRKKLNAAVDHYHETGSWEKLKEI